MMKNQCGTCNNCCREALVRVFPDEIEKWKKLQLYDIILCLETWPNMGTYLMKKKSKCIFLGKNGCEIYDVRPKVCKRFPTSSKHAKQFNCKLDWKTKTRKAEF